MPVQPAPIRPHGAVVGVEAAVGDAARDGALRALLPPSPPLHLSDEERGGGERDLGEPDGEEALVEEALVDHVDERRDDVVHGDGLEGQPEDALKFRPSTASSHPIDEQRPTSSCCPAKKLASAMACPNGCRATLSPAGPSCKSDGCEWWRRWRGRNEATPTVSKPMRPEQEPVPYWMLNTSPPLFSYVELAPASNLCFPSANPPSSGHPSSHSSQMPTAWVGGCELDSFAGASPWAAVRILIGAPALAQGAAGAAQGLAEARTHLRTSVILPS